MVQVKESEKFKKDEKMSKYQKKISFLSNSCTRKSYLKKRQFKANKNEKKKVYYFIL